MDTRTAKSAIRTIFTIADKNDVKIPKPIRDELNKQLKNEQALETYNPGESNILAAVKASLAAGNDPTTDPKVLAEAVKKLIAGSMGGEINSGTELSDTLAQHADSIIDAFKPVYTKAAEAFTKAHATLTAAGAASPDDPGILRGARDVFDASVEARQALDIFADIAKVRSAFLNRGNIHNSPHLTWVLPDTLTPREHEKVRLSNTTLTEWAALDMGATLALANSTEHRERIAELKRLREQESADLTNRAYEARKRADGGGIIR